MILLLAITIVLCLGIAFLLFYRRNKSRQNTAVQSSYQHDVAADCTQQTATKVSPTNEAVTRDCMPNEGNERKVTQNEQLVANLHRVLEEDKVFLRHDIHIDDVAKMLFTNRTYVTQLMRQEYGLSFIEYVNVARIQFSQGLLYTSNMTLDEVAEQSGFQSTTNYCRAFKRYIGTSPIAWLQQVKQS